MAVLPFSSNPFLPREPVAHSYEATTVTPEVDLGELETATASMLEVRVSWGDQILKVQHLRDGVFAVGEGTDVTIPAAVLGTERMEIARIAGGMAEVFVPAGATIDGDVTVQSAWMPASTNGLTFSVGEFTFDVTTTKDGKKPVVPFLQSLTQSAGRHVGLSFFLHAAAVASLAYFLPALGNDDAEAMDRDQIMMMQKYLDAAAEKDLERLEESGAKPEAGDVGQRAAGESGAMGSTVAPVANARWAKKGPSDNANPQLSREAMKAEIMNSGMVSLLSSTSMSDPNAPTSPWGDISALGKDALSANGKMWADNIGDAFGNGGLELMGTGIGGGGTGTGVGLGELGVGHGMGLFGGPGGLGNCTTGDCGSGRGTGLTRMGHKPQGPSMRPQVMNVNGHIPPEVIQRIVRQNFGRFRNCYDNGLRTNPALSGRVVSKFVIDRTGAVSVSQDGGSDMPDRAVVACVVRSFSGLSFPQPEGGIVTVNYPIMFSPGE
jgi:hypothetical protein